MGNNARWARRLLSVAKSVESTDTQGLVLSLDDCPYKRLIATFGLGKTLLERACEPHVRPSVFEDALEVAGRGCLDDIDKDHGGLIHRLMAYEEEEQSKKLVALLRKGADPNLMWNGETSLVSYIHSNHDGAMILLENGADPLLAGTSGGRRLFPSCTQYLQLLDHHNRPLAPLWCERGFEIVGGRSLGGPTLLRCGASRHLVPGSGEGKRDARCPRLPVGTACGLGANGTNLAPRPGSLVLWIPRNPPAPTTVE